MTIKDTVVGLLMLLGMFVFLKLWAAVWFVVTGGLFGW